jgi:phospholipid/cholesterol/gamma-HCH transport system substrate-binding protein
MSRRVLINLGAFVLVFLVMIWWAVNNIISVDRVERPYEITADFAQAAGVKGNAEVTYLGVHFGRVSSVKRRVGGVAVTMKIDRERKIPADSIARIFRKSAIGEPYIDFVPPTSYDPDHVSWIPHDGHVPEDHTTIPLEFSELLRSANALIASIDPRAAGGLVHELALALDGRAPALRSLTLSSDTLARAFADRTEQLDRLAENSTRITGVLADHRLSLGQSLANLRAVTEALRNADGDLDRLLQYGPGFLHTTADLVSDQKQNLDCLLGDLAPVLRAANAPAQIASLRSLLENGPTGFGYVYNTIDQEPDGPWVRVNLMVTTEGTPPKVYTPRLSLPVVPSVAPCASTLRPAGVFTNR